MDNEEIFEDTVRKLDDALKEIVKLKEELKQSNAWIIKLDEQLDKLLE